MNKAYAKGKSLNIDCNFRKNDLKLIDLYLFCQ